MANTFRISLWSGGKAVMVHYINETPKMSEGICAFRLDDGTIIRIMGTVSIEEGTFAERPISGRIGR